MSDYTERETLWQDNERLKARVAELEQKWTCPVCQKTCNHDTCANCVGEHAQSVIDELNGRIEELEAEHTVIADATDHTREVEAGITDRTLAEHVRHVIDNHRDYINTIRLNVPEAYREPQLDLCMVRMRDRIAELETALAAARDVLAAFAKDAGYIPQQQAYSTVTTERERQVWQAVADLDAILTAPEVLHA